MIWRHTQFAEIRVWRSRSVCVATGLRLVPRRPASLHHHSDNRGDDGTDRPATDKLPGDLTDIHTAASQRLDDGAGCATAEGAGDAISRNAHTILGTCRVSADKSADYAQ